MGTSSSYGGPGDRTPLLPAWALPAPVPPDPPPDPGPVPPPVPPNPVPPGTTDLPSGPGAWSQARRRLREAISSGSTGGLRRAAAAYVHAGGGPGGAARSAAGGRKATAAFGGFLSAAAAQGLHAALRGLDLGTVIGHDVDEVLAAIANALAPDGASKEEVAARQAVNDALEELYERLVDEGRDLSALESMTADDVAAAVQASVEAYVYNRWLGDLGVKIEQGTVTAADAVLLERETRDFIRETVRLDLREVNVMTLDWRGEPGRRLVESIYRDAYSLFGGEG